MSKRQGTSEAEAALVWAAAKFGGSEDLFASLEPASRGAARASWRSISALRGGEEKDSILSEWARADSDKTVGAHRARLESTAEIPQSDERVGADGRKINTSNIGSNPTSRDEQATSQEEPPARPREDLVSEATPKPSKSAQQAKESNGAEPRQMAIDLRAELARLEREVNALEQKVEDAKRECSVSDSIAETLRQALRRERRKHKEEVERLEQERDLALADAQLWKTTAQHRASLTRHPDQAEIKRDYKRLSRKFHPDAGGTTEEFQALQRLYQAAEGRA